MPNENPCYRCTWCDGLSACRGLNHPDLKVLTRLDGRSSGPAERARNKAGRNGGYLDRGGICRRSHYWSAPEIKEVASPNAGELSGEALSQTLATFCLQMAKDQQRDGDFMPLLNAVLQAEP